MPRVLAVAYDVGPASPARPASRRAVARVRATRVGGLALDGARPGSLGCRARCRRSLARGRRRRSRRPRLRTPPAAKAAARALAEPGQGTTVALVGGGMPAWVWRLGARLQQALLFPDNQVLWSRRVARLVGAEVRAGDLVLTCSRPESVGCIGPLVQRRGARWWLDFADGWCFQGLRRRGDDAWPPARSGVRTRASLGRGRGPREHRRRSARGVLRPAPAGARGRGPSQPRPRRVRRPPAGSVADAAARRCAAGPRLLRSHLAERSRAHARTAPSVGLRSDGGRRRARFCFHGGPAPRTAGRSRRSGRSATRCRSRIRCRVSGSSRSGAPSRPWSS